MRGRWVVWLGLLVAPVAAEDWLPADLFLEPPRIVEVKLSPRGDRVAALLREPHGASVWVLDPEAGEPRRRLEVRGVEHLHWLGDGSGWVLESGERLAWLPLDGGRPRFFAQLDPVREQRFLGVDPVVPRAVLIREKTPEERYRWLRLGLDGAQEVVLESPEPSIQAIFDADGRVVFHQRTVVGADGRLELAIDRLEPGRREEVVRCDGLDACDPVALDGAGRLLVRGRFERDLWQLWALDLETGRRLGVASDPEGFAELRGVMLDPQTGTALFAVYDTDRRRVYGLSAGLESHLAPLRVRFAGQGLDVQASAAGRFWVLEESGARLQHPRWHLYDTQSRKLAPLFENERRSVAMVPEARLGEARSVSWRASDGMVLHGWLHTPRGVDLARVPLVVRVHGGPWSHVRLGYSALTQLLVDRGYAVFEPNFRGSTGYGWAYLAAARGDFGDGRVQRDILEGLDFVLAQGIGDADRVAILGHSFGGFSTLGALAFTPEKFRAGIASAPPIDLGRALADLDPEKLLPNGLPQKRVAELLAGLDRPEALAELRRKSPEHRLEATVRPLLMFAGGADEKVDVVDVKHYAQALAALGRDVSLVIDETQGHSFETRLATRAYLQLVESFLARHLGGAGRPDADPELFAYFQTTLALIGPSLREALIVAP